MLHGVVLVPSQLQVIDHRLDGVKHDVHALHHDLFFYTSSMSMMTIRWYPAWHDPGGTQQPMPRGRAQ
jgi:hypothetical protein